MQVAMDITARFCGKEMQDYGACVARNPSSWQEQCQHMKLKVAQCTSSHPVIQKIRSDCAGQFAEFERCLQDHQSSAASCSAHMSRFLACAEAVDLSSVAGGSVSQPI
ncbi:coiled-coil-helix-coiled-coil-helix domain-containing protein 5 [Paramormyrops kingsleyae]|uniref:coiled-coil-helix-coiled-coil-helix domain-containing protein 5 n=1 Tax=Paramormyrops kingsleyae TaxID=1676925 RepID=UPI000CD63993|nr:coiled-coil-helix-coiled-coil-helix domain-containing protein 5 isoform X1 [Paramormyrops kingsleyae]